MRRLIQLYARRRPVRPRAAPLGRVHVIEIRRHSFAIDKTLRLLIDNLERLRFLRLLVITHINYLDYLLFRRVVLLYLLLFVSFHPLIYLLGYRILLLGHELHVSLQISGIEYYLVFIEHV